MPIYTLERTQTVRMTLSDCWNFFSDPRNLPKITPPSLKFHVLTRLPEKVYPGLMIQYDVTPILGIRVSWLTEIVQVDEPNYFADEQRHGPYRLWHHEHFFRDLGAGQVEVRDLVHYIPPFGPLGGIINAALIRRQLAAIFDYRSKTLEGMSSAG